MCRSRLALGSIRQVFTSCRPARRARLRGMNASDMTPTQAEQISKWIRAAFEKLAALLARLEALGCDPHDRVFLVIRTARDAIQPLAKDVHAIHCRSFFPVPTVHRAEPG